MTGRRATGSALAILSLVVSGLGCGGDDPTGTALPSVDIVPLYEEPPLQLDELEGPAVVNLWATYCAPCRREIPDFEVVHQEVEGEVRFIGVNIGDDEDDARAYLGKIDVSYDQYLDYDSEVLNALETATLPVTVVIDADGTISERHIGPMNQADLRAAISRASTPEPVDASN